VRKGRDVGWEIPLADGAVRAANIDVVTVGGEPGEGHDRLLLLHNIAHDHYIRRTRRSFGVARSFAYELERGLPDRPGVVPETPSAGTAASMAEVLGAVARINDDAGRGVLDEEMRAIAESAGMDPRGVAGYYSAGLLEKRSDGTRWILQEGRDRLERLVAIQRVHLLDDHESASGPSAPRRPENTSRRPV
jgi:hypothetical protein